MRARSTSSSPRRSSTARTDRAGRGPLSFRGGGTAIQADLSFSYTYSGALGSSSTTVTDIQTTYTISGRFGTAGDASGTVAISSIAFTYEGERYTCSQNPVPWTAKK